MNFFDSISNYNKSSYTGNTMNKIAQNIKQDYTVAQYKRKQANHKSERNNTTITIMPKVLKI